MTFWNSALTKLHYLKFQLYGAATMNNTLCLGIFCALVYFKNLEWYYSAGEHLQ